ncbi:MAG: S-layer homology domain-containing protein [Oscillospiraceae bacterium]|nr:S-layer homology domain-containing protein [Oscillospiraceae bacterium]
MKNQVDWATIFIDSGNTHLTSAAIHYNSTHTHTWDGDAVTTAAGVMTYTCTSCGETYTETIPATGHTEGEAVTENAVAAACTETGSYDAVIYCTVCGATKIEVIAKTGATFLFDDVTDSDAYYYIAVYWAYDRGITAGTSTTTFNPSSNCTRAQMVCFLYRYEVELLS